jgi:hypothetical protein
MKSVYLDIFIRKSDCSSLSSSFNHALDFTENVNHESFKIEDSSLIISSVSGLCFSISLPHQHFITVFDGHQVFNSIQEKLSEKFSINNFVAFIRFSFLHQKSCAIGFESDFIVNKCFETPDGLITNQSAFINSVRVWRVSQHSLNLLKICSVM